MLHWSEFNGRDIIHSSSLGVLGPERFNSVDRIIQEAKGYHPELSGIALRATSQNEGAPRAPLSYDQDTTSSIGKNTMERPDCLAMAGAREKPWRQQKGGLPFTASFWLVESHVHLSIVVLNFPASAGEGHTCGEGRQC